MLKIKNRELSPAGPGAVSMPIDDDHASRLIKLEISAFIDSLSEFDREALYSAVGRRNDDKYLTCRRVAQRYGCSPARVRSRRDSLIDYIKCNFADPLD